MIIITKLVLSYNNPLFPKQDITVLVTYIISLLSLPIIGVLKQHEKTQILKIKENQENKKQTKLEKTINKHEKSLLNMFDQGIIFIKNDTIKYKNTVLLHIEKKARDKNQNTNFLDRKIFKIMQAKESFSNGSFSNQTIRNKFILESLSSGFMEDDVDMLSLREIVDQFKNYD